MATVMTDIAYAYSRYSSPSQASGDSLRRQLKASLAFAEKHGLELDTTLVDKGLSGFTGENRVKGALGSFLRRVERGEIAKGSFLLLDSMDRLSREGQTRTVNMLTNLTLAGIKVVNLAEDHILDDQADTLDYIRVIIHADRSRKESEEKGRKVREAHGDSKRLAREEGIVWHRQGPRWFTATERKDGPIRFVEIPERVAVVRRMFDMAERGMGTGAISRQLNDDGVATFRDTGKGWFQAVVMDILRSRTAIGEYQPQRFIEGSKRRENDGPPIENYYPAIITLDQFHRVQASMDRNALSTKGRGAPRSSSTLFNNLFIGISKCYQCGGTVGYNQSKTIGGLKSKAILRCNAGERHTCLNRVRYDYDALEASILKHVRDVTLPAFSTENTLPDALAMLVAQRAEVDVKVTNLTREIEDGARGLGDALNRRMDERDALDRRIKDLRVELERDAVKFPIKAQQESLSEGMTRMARETDPYQARAAVSEAFKGIVDWIDFDPNGDVRLIIGQGAVTYRFRDGEFVDGWRMGQGTPREAA